MKESSWFYLEPYTHLSLKNNRALLYNTLNGAAIEIEDKPGITTILSRFKANNNLYAAKLTKKDLMDPEKMEFIRRVKESFMGDLLDADGLNERPIQIPPGIKIMESIYQITGEEKTYKGVDILAKLTEVSFFINNTPADYSLRFQGAYKQFLFPSSIGSNQQELELQRIREAITEISGANLLRLNILGGDIFCYSNLRELVHLLDSVPIPKSYFFEYSNLENRDHFITFIRSIQVSQSFKEKRVDFKIFIGFPLNDKKFKKALTLVKQSAVKANFCFIIEKEKDFESAEKKASQYKIDNYSFFPYYNGNNLDFFKDAVFLTREEVFEAKPTMREILRRSVINDIKFGKLTVTSNGDIYADVNQPKLGKLGKDSFHEIIYKEIFQGKSWKQTRTKVNPCRRCTFQFLCPPPSHYEHAIGRYNICHIWPKELNKPGG